MKISLPVTRVFIFSEQKHQFTVTHHESLLNAKVIMDDFSQGGQAVGGAGGIAINRKTDSH